MSQPISPVAVDPDALPLRQCGRCRQWFDGDPALLASARPEWWACDPCRAVLLGGPRRQRA